MSPQETTFTKSFFLFPRKYPKNALQKVNFRLQYPYMRQDTERRIQMKTLYLECNMGASADTLMGSLYEICDKKDLFLETMNRAFEKYNISLIPESSVKCGISGTNMQALIRDKDEDIFNQIHTLNLPNKVKEDAAAIPSIQIHTAV